MECPDPSSSQCRVVEMHVQVVTTAIMDADILVYPQDRPLQRSFCTPPENKQDKAYHMLLHAFGRLSREDASEAVSFKCAYKWAF